MIWHVRFEDFEAFLKSIGFRRAAQTPDQFLYERGSETLIVRRSTTLTQAEIDAVCDNAGLLPPPFHCFFGD